MSVLRLELKPSLRLAAVILSAHAAAAVSVFACLPGAVGGLLACALLALGGAAAWRRALLRSASSVRTLEIDGAKLTLGLRDGRAIPALAAERRYVARWLVVLPLRRSARGAILVSADMLDAGSLRLLRVWALWAKLPAAAPARAVAGKQLAA